MRTLVTVYDTALAAAIQVNEEDIDQLTQFKTDDSFSVDRVDDGDDVLLTITFHNKSLTLVDSGANGAHIALEMYQFEQQLLKYEGGVTKLNISGAADTDFTTTAALVGSVGTDAVATDNATLTSLEANLIPSTAATFSSRVGNMNGVATTALLAILDGTTTGIKAYLNLACPDAGISANGTVVIRGYIQLRFKLLGDK